MFALKTKKKIHRYLFRSVPMFGKFSHHHCTLTVGWANTTRMNQREKKKTHQQNVCVQSCSFYRIHSWHLNWFISICFFSVLYCAKLVSTIHFCCFFFLSVFASPLFNASRVVFFFSSLNVNSLFFARALFKLLARWRSRANQPKKVTKNNSHLLSKWQRPTSITSKSLDYKFSFFLLSFPSADNFYQQRQQ